MTLRCHTADLHVHTCLSPCADACMTPAAIVRSALEAGLAVIGICDHNSALNVKAVQRAAERSGLSVVGGMEITSREEVHVLGLFDTDDGGEALGAMQDAVYACLPGKNDERAFGEQLVCDEDGVVVGREERLLIGATMLSVEEVVGAIHDHGGIAIASHVDREGFGLIGQLGFIPEGLALDALELSPRAEAMRERWGRLWSDRGLPLIASSDAHRPSEVGAVSTDVVVESVCVAELRKALRGADGREISV